MKISALSGIPLAFWVFVPPNSAPFNLNPKPSQDILNVEPETLMNPMPGLRRFRKCQELLISLGTSNEGF